MSPVARRRPSRRTAPLSSPREPSLAERRQRTEKLAEAWIDRASSERRGRSRAKCLLEVARLFDERLADPERAFTAMLAAYRARPRRAEWPELHRLAAMTRRWRELADELRAAIPNLAARDRADAWVHLGRVHELWLGERDLALGAYRSSLECDPLRVAGLLALGGVFDRAGDGAALARALGDAQQAAPTERRVQLWRELAQLELARGERAGAVRALEGLLAEAPGDAAALTELSRQLELLGEREKLQRTLEAMVGIVDDPEQRAALYRRLAAQHERDGARVRAAECWECLLEFRPTDEEAFRSLERLYLEERRWRAAIDAACRHAQVAAPSERSELHRWVGDLYQTALGDAERAADSFEKVEPRDESVRAALEPLYEQLGRFDRLAALLIERAEQGGPAAAREWLRAGRLAERELADDGEAERCYLAALGGDPGCGEARIGLAAIYLRRGEASRCAQAAREALAAVDEPSGCFALLALAGRAHQEQGENEKSIEAWLEALALRPDDEEAAERATALLRAAGRTVELIPLLERQARRASGAQQVARLCDLGAAAAAVGRTDLAVDAYGRAAAIDPRHLEALRARGRLELARGGFAAAEQALVAALDAHGTSLPAAERVELHCAVGDCARRLGRDVEARVHAQAARALDPSHRGALELQAALDADDPAELVAVKRALLAMAAPEERVALWSEIGDLYRERLADRRAALEAYRTALEISPGDHRLRLRCLDLLVEEGQWAESLAVLDQLVAAEKTPAVRAKYRHAAAMIHRDELHREEQALALLRAALDDDPAHDAAAEAIEEVLERRGDFTGLQAHLSGLLQRLGARPEDEAQRLRLWAAIADLCGGELAEPDSALAALEVVLRLDPRDVERRRRKAELHVEAGEDQLPLAIREHQAILRLEPGRLPSYRALADLYGRTGEPNRARACAVATRVIELQLRPSEWLPGAESPEVSFDAVQAPLAPEAWSRLIHPDEDRLLSALFGIVAPALVALRALPLEQLGLEGAEPVAFDDRRPFARALAVASRRLGLPLPQVYLRPAQTEPVTFANLRTSHLVTPSLVVGRAMLGHRRDPRDLAFLFGRQIAHLRADRILRMVLDPPQLTHVVKAAVALCDDAAPASGSVRETVGWLRANLSPIDRDQLTTIGARLRDRERSCEAMVAAWLRAADLTASRVGLALAHDLERCAALIAREPSAAPVASAEERVIDLAWSSISDELWSLHSPDPAPQPAVATRPGLN